MKKTLVAVAALVATGAFAQVTISGVIESAIKSTGGTTTLTGGNNAGSEMSVGVVEDLGNGLKAMGSTTICWNNAQGNGNTGMALGCGLPSAGKSTGTGTIAMTYNNFVGLSSADFGSVKIGQQFSNTFLAASTGDMTGRGIGGTLAGGVQAQVANSLSYASPSFSGVSVAYQQTLDNSSAGYTNYAINYSNGGLNAAYASGKTGSTTEGILGASYDFGVAKLFAGSATSTGSSTATNFGVTVPVGAITLGAQASKDSAAKNQTTLSGTYSLSKRTSVYLVNVASDAAATANYVGIQHKF